MIGSGGSMLGGLDTSSMMDAFSGGDGGGVDDGSQYGNSDPSTSDYSQDSYGNSETNGPYQGYQSQGSGGSEHLNSVLHAFTGAAAGQQGTRNAPFLNHNGLPIIRNIDMKTAHFCDLCGETIPGTRLKCNGPIRSLLACGSDARARPAVPGLRLVQQGGVYGARRPQARTRTRVPGHPACRQPRRVH